MLTDSSSSLPQSGAVFGPYRLEAILGQGGMGAVYRARHSETGAVHALKLVLVADRPGMEDFLVERFQREVEVLARIEGHPGLVRVFTSGEEAGIPWYAMELVDGVPLSEELKQQVMGPRRAAALVAQVARAVAHAHRQGVVHRDLKPSNILVDGAGQVHVADFGLAHDACSQRLTQTGEILGTPQFMAPEQVEADVASEFGGIGPATDVYGLGAVLYACLTGQPPFGRKPARELMIDIVTKDPAAPSTQVSGMPLDLDAICLRALAREPERRYRTAGGLADDLERWLRDEPVLARRVGTLETLWRRHRPRSRAGRWAAGGLAVALCVVMSGGLYISIRRLIWDPPLGQRLEKLEFTQIGPGGLDAAGRSELEDLSRLVADFGEPGDATRLEVIRQLEKVTSNLPGRRQQAIERLAELVEEAGDAKERLLKRVCQVLRREERFDDLVRLFYGSKPLSQQPAPLVAKDMARALTRDGVILELPGDREAFSHLYEMADRRVKPRLLKRRLDQMLAQQDWALSLATALKMRRAHVEGMTDDLVDASEWPVAFVEHVQEEFADLVAANSGQQGTAQERLTKVQKLQFYMDLLARGPDPSSSVSLDQAYRIGKPIMAVVNNRSLSVDGVFSSEALESLIFLELRGASPFAPELYRQISRSFSLKEFEALGRMEAERSKENRNPVRCLVLSRLVLSVPHSSSGVRQPTPESKLARSLGRRWLDAAREVGLEDVSGTGGPPRWQSVMESHVYDLLNGPDERGRKRPVARTAWRHALEADRVRPFRSRWPRLVSVVLARQVDSFSLLPGSEQKIRREAAQEMANLGLELIDVFEAAWAVSGLSSQADFVVVKPWLLMDSQDIAVRLSLLCALLVDSMGDECCSGGWLTSAGRPILEDLLDRALKLLAGDTSSDGRAAATSVLRVRASHHRRHGRLGMALLDLDDCLANAKSLDSVRELRRLDALWLAYDARIPVLRDLGREKEAVVEEQAMQAHALKLRPLRARYWLLHERPNLALTAIRAGMDSARQLEVSNADTRRRRLERLWELYELEAEAQRMAGREDEARAAQQKAQQVLDKLESLR